MINLYLANNINEYYIIIWRIFINLISTNGEKARGRAYVVISKQSRDI